MSQPLEITLPWPSRDLHPNVRVHWTRKAMAAKLARAYAFYVTRQAHMRAPPAGRLQAWIDAYPPDHRRRDADGVLSALKPSLDGIADALGVDDRWFVPHPMVMDEVRRGGEVRIRITGTPVERGNDES